MITTTYETSELLWDAGVRIEAELWYVDEILHYQDKERIDDAIDDGFDVIPAPTFTELVDWLNKKGYAFSYAMGVTTFCLIYGDNRVHSHNTNFTEAAAECCLEVMRRERTP